MERSYSQAEKTIKDHADTIKAQDFGMGLIPACGDPSGAQWFSEFAQYDLHIEPALKEIGQNARGWVEHCVERVNELLKQRQGHLVKFPDGREIVNAPRFFVLDTPENEICVRQIENLKWRENRITNEVLPMLDESDDPTTGHYDLMAALRYAVTSYRPMGDKITPIRQWSKNAWRIGK